ncbi:MAG: hypothetical protein CSB44_08270 [Gammaproteobacteria bacterium]|nr:MAG: hypothetical protein CSB44_08270 [Gammaproteobacteria bacterium]
MSDVIVQALGFVSLLAIGYSFGRLAEKRHLRNIIRREQALAHLPAVASKNPPAEAGERYELVSGSVVIASDYFKRFLAGLITLFGGRLAPYESMLDRARREAMLRMKDEARRKQAGYVFNVKYQTASVSGSGRGAGALEVLAYGTAVIPASPHGSETTPG